MKVSASTVAISHYGYLMLVVPDTPGSILLSTVPGISSMSIPRLIASCRKTLHRETPSSPVNSHVPTQSYAVQRCPSSPRAHQYNQHNRARADIRMPWCNVYSNYILQWPPILCSRLSTLHHPRSRFHVFFHVQGLGYKSLYAQQRAYNTQHIGGSSDSLCAKR